MTRKTIKIVNSAYYWTDESYTRMNNADTSFTRKARQDPLLPLPRRFVDQ